MSICFDILVPRSALAAGDALREHGAESGSRRYRQQPRHFSAMDSVPSPRLEGDALYDELRRVRRRYAT